MCQLLVYTPSKVCHWDSCQPSSPKTVWQALRGLALLGLLSPVSCSCPSCALCSHLEFALFFHSMSLKIVCPHQYGIHISQPHLVCVKNCYSQCKIMYHFPHELTLASYNTPKAESLLFPPITVLLLECECLSPTHTNNS